MIRLLLLMTLLLNITYASSEKYFIKFGSFKNLKGLEKNIAKLPTSLRSHVVIVYANSWYIPFAYYTSNKYALRAKVDWYKRYFKDAHVAHSSSMLSYPLVRNYAKKRTKVKVTTPRRRYTPPTRVTYPHSRPQSVGLSQANYTFQSVQHLPPVTPVTVNPVTVAPVTANPVTIQPKIVTQKVVYKEVPKKDTFSISKIKRYKHFTKEMLGGNHFYLAYKKEGENPNLLIKVSFENHEVTYQPVIGEMQMTKANDNKLYMFANTFSKNGSFSKLEEHHKNYFLVSSWGNGKKLNTLRYYYKMNDAKKFLGIPTSSGLAEILSEGDYDELFVDE